jgi:hypothetical protein
MSIHEFRVPRNTAIDVPTAVWKSRNRRSGSRRRDSLMIERTIQPYRGLDWNYFLSGQTDVDWRHYSLSQNQKSSGLAMVAARVFLPW